MTMRIIPACLLFLTAAPAIAAGPAPAKTPEVRFYNQEAFTIVYEQTGSVESGTITEHVSDWGRRRVEIKKLVFKYGSVNNETHQRVIYDGPNIITVDMKTGAGTRTVNPLYTELTAGLAGKDAVEYGKAWAKAMGGQPTGKTAVIAGQTCEKWTAANLGTEFCVTGDGLTLTNATKLGPVSIVRTAKDVKIGDGGPADAYAYDAAKVQEGPDLSKFLNKGRRPY